MVRKKNGGSATTNGPITVLFQSRITSRVRASGIENPSRAASRKKRVNSTGTRTIRSLCRSWVVCVVTATFFEHKIVCIPISSNIQRVSCLPFPTNSLLVVSLVLRVTSSSVAFGRRDLAAIAFRSWLTSHGFFLCVSWLLLGHRKVHCKGLSKGLSRVHQGCQGRLYEPRPQGHGKPVLPTGT